MPHFFAANPFNVEKQKRIRDLFFLGLDILKTNILTEYFGKANKFFS